MSELLGLPYSPWSEKARWVLDIRRVPYTYRIYAPLLGEPALRKKLNKWTGPVSVPVLTDDHGLVIPDSAAIARWADGHGEGPTLFPVEHEAAMAHFVELSERGLSAGRGLSLFRMLEDREALAEMVPKPLRSVRPIATRIGAFGIRRTLRKYGATRLDREGHERNLTAVLDELRRAIEARPRPPGTGPQLLLGSFSFADVAMAQVLAFVEPPSFGLKVGRASRRTFTDPALKERYADLLAWRNALYQSYRLEHRTAWRTGAKPFGALK